MPFDQHSRGEKEKKPEYQYNKAKYHPVEEYLVTFTEKLTSDTPSFVLEVTWPRVALFYHPASPLCVQLRDRYVLVAREIRRRSIRAPVEFWAVSCEIHREACEDLGINAVPRLLGFPQGSIEGKLIQRTKNNNIEVEDIVEVLDVSLKEVDEAEIEAQKLRQKEKADKVKMLEYQKNNVNDPKKMHIGESDHMREILHPHSNLADVYSDAMESFLRSIHSNVKQGSNGDVDPWAFDRLTTFREWLDLMHWSLPTRDMALLHNVINDMRNNFKFIEISPKEVTKILKSHDYFRHKRKWSSSCASANPEDEGFSCGFWKLLHIMSVGVMEQHGAVMGDLDRTLVGHTVGVVRDFVQEFGFANNEEARKEIVAAYSDCQADDLCRKEVGLEKKGLLARFRKKIPVATDPSWRGCAIWLWRAHQAYRTKRLGQSKKGYDSLLDFEDVQWPPAALCPKCYASGEVVDPEDHHLHFNQDVIRDPINEVTWNKQHLYEHLKREYWPKTLQSPRVVVIDRLNRHKGLGALEEDAKHSGWTIVSLLLFVIAICLSLNLSKVRQFLASSRGNRRRKKKPEDQNVEDDRDWTDSGSNAPPSSDQQSLSLVRPRRRGNIGVNGGRSARYIRPQHVFLDD
jgi:transposase